MLKSAILCLLCELKRKNKVLVYIYWYGLLCGCACVELCKILIFYDNKCDIFQDQIWNCLGKSNSMSPNSKLHNKYSDNPVDGSSDLSILVFLNSSIMVSEFIFLCCGWRVHFSQLCQHIPRATFITFNYGIQQGSRTGDICRYCDCCVL